MIETSMLDGLTEAQLNEVISTNPLKRVGKTIKLRGFGNFDYDIVEVQPQKSIFIYRMESTDPGVMMSEVGRRTTQKEGVELVKAWIESLK
jgi:hypothetical protein